ncbi:MAG: hypothetical protein HUU15_02045 [Candidatus Brocadiae bacterium]|nr:hypothetical protein [Candidatus Brocadiia bacterium]
MNRTTAVILGAVLAATALGVTVSTLRGTAPAPDRGAPAKRAAEPTAAPAPRPSITHATAVEDFETRGCDHDHLGVDPDPQPPPPAQPEPWMLPERAVRRIERDLGVAREQALEVARILGEHLETVAMLESSLADSPDSLDSTVTGEAWARTEDRLRPLLTADQIDRLRLIPFEPPPAARRD